MKRYSNRSFYSLLAYAMLAIVSLSEESRCSPIAVAQGIPEVTGTLEDKPLAAFQSELLDIAFDTAASIPVEPHIKDRSRAQEAVIVVALQLDQPNRAAAYCERIDNWRRGSCFADLAFYCARRGDLDSVHRYLKRAEEQIDTVEDWRKDRIRVTIARTRVLLGERENAGRLDADVVNSEAGKIAGVLAMQCDENSFDGLVNSLDGTIAKGDFDLTKNTLEVYVQLFIRFYSDVKRRSLVEDRIKTSWDPLPIAIRIDLLMELANGALSHSDPNKALELVNEAHRLQNDYQWPLEYGIPMTAKLIGLRYQAGDKNQARTDADSIYSLVMQQKNSIVDIWRAGTLRPLAEAYHTMGDRETALSVYKEVLEDGVENPNSRPRAEDLSATCRSMALYAVEPDAELLARIKDIYKKLGSPW